MPSQHLTRKEIVDYARRYVGETEVGDFPHDGDLFCFLHRQASSGNGEPGEKKWEFDGYGQCIGYTLDEEATPSGKWLWFLYADLSTFPPAARAMKLQPPHVAKGSFHSADRQSELRILKISAEKGPGTPDAKEDTVPPKTSGKILRFPSKG
ncbi:MAG: hypothetical protein GF418_02955 [Chitinivibrionales bacterium]|nr:hypothetical protein [Chitinivibrionales bacterium]MBD3394561.1 hypothetical protein [Chitinivibrionales bacterium]